MKGSVGHTDFEIKIKKWKMKCCSTKTNHTNHFSQLAGDFFSLSSHFSEAPYAIQLLMATSRQHIVISNIISAPSHYGRVVIREETPIPQTLCGYQAADHTQ